MRTLVIVACLLLPPAAAAQPAAPMSGDESAIRRVVDRYVTAREARDARALEALFTDDADQYTTTGDWRRGRAQMLPGMAASSAQNPGVRAITVEAVRFINPDVAIADGGYHIAGSDARRWTTIVLARTKGEWRIAAIRNMSR